jgi:SAM-dependent methyltransferase
VAESSPFWRGIHKVLEIPLVFRLQQNLCNNYGSVRAEFQAELGGGPHRYLDVGCSTGASVSKLFDLEKEDYTGIELVPEYAAIAQRMNPHGKFLAMDARKMDLPDASYDRILFLAVMHHMDDATCRDALKEAHRVLAPGGKVLVAENIFTPGRFWSSLFLRHDRGDFIRKPEGYRALVDEALWAVERDNIFEFSLHRMYSMVLVRRQA